MELWLSPQDRQLKMTRWEWTPINAAVWKAAGDPSDKQRAQDATLAPPKMEECQDR